MTLPNDIGNPNETVFTIPPSPLRNIGDELNEKKISWAYYGDQWSAYLANPDGNYVTPDNTYCNICDFFQYSRRWPIDVGMFCSLYN